MKPISAKSKQADLSGNQTLIQPKPRLPTTDLHLGGIIRSSPIPVLTRMVYLNLNRQANVTK